MKQVTINLYSFHELGKVAQRKAIEEHKEFMESIPAPVEVEEGHIKNIYEKYNKAEVIDNIEANEYVFFEDGELASVVEYCGNHEKAGKTEFTFHGRIYNI